MITKTTMVVIINLQNSHVLTLSLPTEEVFLVNDQSRPVANLQLSIFIRSRKKSPNTKHQTPNTKATEYVTFGFSSNILVFFPFYESLNLTVCQRYWFFNILAAIIRAKYKQLVFRIMKVLPFIHQPHRVAPKASDVSAADWLYQHTWKNTIFFTRVLLRLCSGPEIPV